MRKFIQKQLAGHARRKILVQKPVVVAVTGSVGKSSAKQAMGAVLARKFKVGANEKNYNNEVGLPLTILRLPAGRRSYWKWLKILARAWWKSGRTEADYPQLLILEMAADHPGDIAYLTDIAPPDIAVVTAIGESHVENFGSIANVAKEKQVLVQRLGRDGVAILNHDDELVWAMREKTKAKVMSYGFHEEADVRAVEVSMHYDVESEDGCGLRLKIAAGGSTIPVFLPKVLGRHAAYAALAATAVGLAKGMNLVEIAEGLRAYEPPPGRTRCLAGIKRTLLIDDTYNASPRSTKAALAILRDLPADGERQRIAALGDMLELGTLSVSGHEEVGREAAGVGLDLLVLVGERMGDAQSAALAAGFPADRLVHFSTTEEAGRFVQEKMKKGDIILIKGSRGMHMDKVTKELMAEPLRAAELLVEAHE
ncbi:MAG: UDP-N-acetylmuramoyl-tripeptide--D-alanyl-D-alanine ligase [Patescibacteria group bacterium]|jgi:UDP-N-acetylmuramoyl-tripeptide--D-alanyl-D-alanine ligase